MRRTFLWPALVVLPLLTAAPSIHAETTLKAGAFTPAQEAPNFSLRGTDGLELTLSQLRGHVVLLVFGFTNCPAVCPTTLATLAQTRQTLGAMGGRLRVIFITVDPERDDLEVMRKYLAAFDANFIGGTGAPDQLAKIWANYGVTAIKVTTAYGYGIDHSSSVYIIDAVGKLRGMMPFGRTVEDYTHDVKLLIGE